MSEHIPYHKTLSGRDSQPVGPLPDQPKPTVEWTSDELVECVNGVGYKELARRVNASLAAEKEKFKKAKEWNRITELEVNNLRSLLNEIDPDISRKTIAELRQQLAVAVECLEWLRREFDKDDYYVEKIDIAFAKIGVK